MSAELTKSEQAAIKRVQADQAAFEVWCKTEGLPVTLAKEMECWDTRFPATYWIPNTETAWRAWANKPVPEQGALTDALPLVFGMSGKNMTFTIGVQKFTLMYTPDDSQEFEFMSAMLTKAISQVKGQVNDMSLRSDAADAWLPIATAPKDGSVILLGRAEDEANDRGPISTAGRWHDEDHDGPDNMGHDAGFMDDEFQQFAWGRSFGNSAYKNGGYQPTHWQLLPAPPAIQAQAGDGQGEAA